MDAAFSSVEGVIIPSSRVGAALELTITVAPMTLSHCTEIYDEDEHGDEDDECRGLEDVSVKSLAVSHRDRPFGEATVGSGLASELR